MTVVDDPVKGGRGKRKLPIYPPNCKRVSEQLLAGLEKGDITPRLSLT
jgi:hypothetical protein